MKTITKPKTRWATVAAIALALSWFAYVAIDDVPASGGGADQGYQPLPVEPDGGIGDTPIPVEPDGGIGDTPNP